MEITDLIRKFATREYVLVFPQLNSTDADHVQPKGEFRYLGCDIIYEPEDINMGTYIKSYIAYYTNDVLIKHINLFNAYQRCLSGIGSDGNFVK